MQMEIVLILLMVYCIQSAAKCTYLLYIGHVARLRVGRWHHFGYHLLQIIVVYANATRFTGRGTPRRLNGFSSFSISYWHAN